MKKIYILFIISIILFSCGQKRQSRGAKIEFENTEFNIGKVKQGETAECYFVVKNSGDSTLVFNQIIPNCNCTSMTSKNAEIFAGESDTLKFVLDTHGKEIGRYVGEIRIITNTIPDFHKLKITAEIE